jgi:hypothetical protein
MQITKEHETEGTQVWSYTEYMEDHVIPITWNDYDFDLDCHFVVQEGLHQKHIGDRLILYPDDVGAVVVNDQLTGYVKCVWERVQFKPITVSWDGNTIVITPELQHEYLGDYFSHYLITVSNGKATYTWKHSLLYSDRIMISKETLNNILKGNFLDNPYFVANDPVGMYIPQKYYDKVTNEFHPALKVNKFYKMRERLGDIEYIYMPIIDDEEATNQCSTT